jgi:tryptophan synthase alpha chain
VTSSALDLIRLIAPTTDDRRLTTAVSGASGFVYLISRLGVTGDRDSVPADLEPQVRRVRAVSRLPVAVGFGIGTPAQAAAAARHADGVVVGSALLDVLAKDGVAAMERLARDLAAAVHG